MWTDGTKTYGTKAFRVVAAIFFDEVTARDAIVDLKLAGFPAGAIAVAPSPAGEPAEGGQGATLAKDLSGEHTMHWRLRHTFKHDLHARRTDLTSVDDVVEASREEVPFTEIELKQTLLQSGVAPATIQLLQDRMGSNGMLIMVDAGDRVDEVESILVRDGGMLRNVMATEQSRITS